MQEDKSGNRWGELRFLLVGPEKKRLEKLEKRLDDPALRAGEIGDVLPEAVAKTSGRNDALGRALTPMVETAVHESVKKNTKTFANVLYPVIRPAIQKAISSTFKRMIQSFNRAIEHTVSIKGLRWRFQSIVTGKPFAEVVLLHSLVFSVDKLFLIQRETGLLLHQAQSALDISQDGDLVSSMLKAIQDFVQDSFHVDREEGLETIQVGDFSIWIEQGEYAILAAVVRGSAPEKLRSQLKDALQKLEHHFRDEFTRFTGDTAPFEKTGYLLEPCLQTDVKQEKKKIPLLSWLLLIALVAFIGYTVYSGIAERRRWAAYVEAVERIPGVVVTATGKKDGRRFIKGLRDPLSQDPAKLPTQYRLTPGEVDGHWTYYHSLVPRYIKARAAAVLKPPSTVQLVLKDGVLRAVGKAPHRWIRESNLLAGAVAGIRRFDNRRVKSLEEEPFHRLVTHIETQRFTFEIAESQLLPGQEERLDILVEDIKKLLALAGAVGQQVHITITGHTDRTGTDSFNQKIRIARAETFLRFLVAQDIPRRHFSARGADTQPPGTPDAPRGESPRHRSISFTVNLSPTAEKQE